MRRIACVHLPEVRLEIAGSPSPSLAAAVTSGRGPLAVVVARPGGSVRTERDILGNTRLDVVSAAAHKAGVRPGQTVAAATAKAASLRVRVVLESSVQTTLARVAEAALAFGPSVAFDVAHDVVWVDVTGCAHLHGGEVELARALELKVGALGHACRVAVASGPRIASAVARFSKHAHRAQEGQGPIVVPEGAEAAAMRVLPVAALGLDDGVTAWLRELGLARCGGLQRLPRRSLGARLGLRAHDVMQLLDGDDRAPLPVWRPPEVPEERMELEWGATSVESLAFLLKVLCERLTARLEGRAMAVARLELALSLDRALCEPGRHREVVSVVLPVPLSRAGDLLAVLRTRLEGHELAAPVMALTLTATELARTVGRTLDMLEPEPVADRVLPRLVAELSAELGAARVGILALVDTWVPEERTELRPFGAPGRQPSLAASRARGALEPTRLAPPEAIDPSMLGELHLLLRLEAPEWWARPVEARDLVAAWVAEGDSGALAWVALPAPSAMPALAPAAGRDPASRLGWVD